MSDNSEQYFKLEQALEREKANILSLIGKEEKIKQRKLSIEAEIDKLQSKTLFLAPTNYR